MRFPKWLYLWMRIGVPILIVAILLSGWVPLVQSWVG